MLLNVPSLVDCGTLVGVTSVPLKKKCRLDFGTKLAPDTLIVEPDTPDVLSSEIDAGTTVNVADALVGVPALSLTVIVARPVPVAGAVIATLLNVPSLVDCGTLVGVTSVPLKKKCKLDFDA